jgi:magnesium-transporting ATPase (P-type)
MVDLVKTGIPTVRTLAIGDGANDVPMIQEAHVGVGIKGEEGLQAVNSSDYAIAQFRYLELLLLKHGRYNYIRMSNLVCYVFYKNVLCSITMFWFNMYNGFSGQKMFAEGAIQMFNLLFTSIPILFYGCYDQDVPSDVVRKHPKMYMDGVHNRYFNAKVFWSWVFTALWQSVIMCLLSFVIFKTESKGETAPFWGPGALAYTAVIMIVNGKLIAFQSQWAWGNYGIVALSIAVWWLFASTITLNMDLAQFDWYHVFTHILADGSFWLGLLWLLVVAILYEVALHGFWRAFWYNNTHVLQEQRPTVTPHDADVSAASVEGRRASKAVLIASSKTAAAGSISGSGSSSATDSGAYKAITVGKEVEMSRLV